MARPVEYASRGCWFVCSSQAGEATSPHHAHHGLRAAAVPASRRTSHYGPGPTVFEAVLARGAQAHERHQHSTGTSHVPQGKLLRLLLSLVRCTAQ